MARYSRRNPVWVTPGGKAGYLSSDDPDQALGYITKKGVPKSHSSGQHSSYQAKHPTRGRVPSFIEREARMELPPGDLAPGWSTKVEIIERPAGNTTKYHLFFQGEHTGKYALDPSKAAILSHALEQVEGQWKKKRWNKSAKKNPGQSEFRAYMAEKKAAGWPHKKALAGWSRKKKAADQKARISKDVVGTAELAIYKAAEDILGRSDFLHEAGMLDLQGEKQLQVVLHSPKWSTFFTEAEVKKFMLKLRQIQKKYKPYGLKMTAAVRNNPFAKYATDVNLPGLKARRGEEYHYPVRPEKYGEPGAIATQHLAPGFEIVPGYKVGKGKRAMVFKLFFDGQDTGKYSTSPERAAELSFRLKPDLSRDYSKGKLKARFNPDW